MVTLREIAKKLGVSSATVSRVLNFDTTLSVGLDTRRAIIEKAEALNYETPRRRKRNLGQKNGDIILLHNRTQTAFVLDQLLTSLERRGFHFVLPS